MFWQVIWMDTANQVRVEFWEANLAAQVQPLVIILLTGQSKCRLLPQSIRPHMQLFTLIKKANLILLTATVSIKHSHRHRHRQRVIQWQGTKEKETTILYRRGHSTQTTLSMHKKLTSNAILVEYHNFRWN